MFVSAPRRQMVNCLFPICVCILVVVPFPNRSGICKLELFNLIHIELLS